MRRAIRTHDSYETEYRIILTDGTIRWIGGRARCLVAVIDIFMPEMSGLEVQTRLRRISPSTRVIVLTAKDDPSVRRTAMNSGASAFFLKGVESGEFLAGIKAAAESTN